MRKNKIKLANCKPGGGGQNLYKIRLNYGFTLIELLGVLIILAVIALITFPIIDNSIKSSREKSLERTIDTIEEAAYRYSIENDIGYPSEQQALYLNEIQNKGFLSSSIINPVTNEELAGCVWYYWDTNYNQYVFEYDMECVQTDTEPVINIAYNEDLINSNGWAKEDIAVTLSGNGDIKYCISSNECEPNEIIETGNNTKFITTEGTTYLCASTSNSLGNSNTLCQSFNLDKTNPTAGTATFAGTLGSNDWYTTDITVNVIDGSDNLSGHSSTISNIESITSNTTGTTVRITTTDLAGNSSSRDYLIKVDKDSPSLIAKDGAVEITEGDSNVVSNYFNASYSISGGSISCTPTNTNSLDTGTQTLSCTATGGNGKTASASKQITVKAAIYEDNTGANSPELLDNMIPIKYNGSNWVYADVTQEWYDYDNKEWANAVVLNSGVSKNVGDTISESEIALWYVWIPRYKYQLFNANNGSVLQQLINVEFESGTATTGTVSCTDAVSGSGSSSETCTNAENGNWYTHPAFTFGDEELTGFWIGKFEVSGSINAMTIKPGVSNLSKRTVSNFFLAIQNISAVYNLSGDSHMIKNMEWGAVAYLKQSKYGLGTIDLDANYSGYAGGDDDPVAYKTKTTLATTGTIYGVYDMSGRAWEYVMGNMVSSSGSFYDSGAGFGGSVPNEKYYDKYTYSTSNTAHGRGKLGDALKETLSTFGSGTGGWYNDYTNFAYSSYSWFKRGGSSGDGSKSGVFASLNANGSGVSNTGTRAVLIP